ncbi:hypothetical protein [Nocardiopsis ganjiahuensis]|uniref:hypothetical protein n=1 Tax=Nocardiopsis ganjiahuensis TaxID=239984 RepID=UPI00034BF7F8|nr:hypothetical protein [Nocardiopsis ganjiahuensis]
MFEKKSTAHKSLIVLSVVLLAASSAVAFLDPFTGARLGGSLVGAASLLGFAILSVSGQRGKVQQSAS